ncbi:hypothetical protein H8B02_20330 [Bradyrhizobium sp. Pear77]|uniref:hypothetical protein n=1 Tax=Bradyrhizobium altum TaxID=1571202 RepID=UPI001E477A72|nr:hypothetical protein [Bradyrhizobium altum]MCC8955695.1 hypothetical protein [Bradyrhizobium altum]
MLLLLLVVCAPPVRAVLELSAFQYRFAVASYGHALAHLETLGSPMTNDDRKKLAETLKMADLEVLKEIVREAESFLAAQLTAGLASDQRAINTAVYLAAILAAIVGGTATLVSVGTSLGWHLLGIGWIVGFLAFALIHAVRAARPTPFSYSGNNPAHWAPDVQEKRSLRDSLAGQAAIYAQGIRSNIKCLNDAHAFMNVSLIAGVIGVLGFVLVEFIVVMSVVAKTGHLF